MRLDDLTASEQRIIQAVRLTDSGEVSVIVQAGQPDKLKVFRTENLKVPNGSVPAGIRQVIRTEKLKTK